MKFFIALMLLFSVAHGRTIRKQEFVPVDVQCRVQENVVQCKFTYRQDMLNFSVVNVRGIGGLSLEGELNSVPKDVRVGETDNMSYEYTKDPGRTYMVMELRGTVEGMNREQIFSLPVGDFTKEEIKAGIDKEIMTVPSEEGPIRIQ